jgi:hypothetical protein
MWRIHFIGLFLCFSASSALHAQDYREELGIRELVTQSEINIRNNPRDGQRYCRDALRKIAMDPFAEQFSQEKVKCFSLLGESYFNIGRIGDAAAQFDSVVVLTAEVDPMNRKAKHYQRQIDELFGSLQIKVKNRIVPLLSYIKGIEIEFRYPKKLQPVQVSRLRVLQSAQSRKENEFQFTGVDQDGSAYMEIEYFPLLETSGRSSYSLIVDGTRRYRFQFSSQQQDPLEIVWEDEADWKLIERVPDDMIKIELPGKYHFKTTAAGADTLSASWRGSRHVYLTGGTDAELELVQSDENGWERVYDIALYGFTGVTALIGLMGAR